MAGGKGTDEPKVKVFSPGAGGVNVVKDPHQLGDDEVSLAQNAEVVFDENVGGLGSLSKRGGLQVLSTGLAGSLLGMTCLPLPTTYTRYLYASLRTAAANTFAVSSDGTTFTPTSNPLAGLSTQTKLMDVSSIGIRLAQITTRFAAFGSRLYYPGNTYTQDTDPPPIDAWDGTAGTIVFKMPSGPSSAGTVSRVVVDTLTANGRIYMSIHEQGGATPNLRGYVVEFLPESGRVRQICNAFGSATGFVTGGAPGPLAWHAGQLWVGLQPVTGVVEGTEIGKIVRCHPDIDTTWTTDISTLAGYPSSMVSFRGELYCGTQESEELSGPDIYRRSATLGTWSSVDAGGTTTGNGHYAALTVYNDELYAIQFHNSVADILVIRKSADGTTWATDRDVAVTDSGIISSVPLFPGQGIVYGGDLFMSFKAVSESSTDGFILRKRSGTWTKVYTGNVNGPMAVLLLRT